MQNKGDLRSGRGETVRVSFNDPLVGEYEAEGLPKGLTIDATTGIVTGVPTTFETAKVKVRSATGRTYLVAWGETSHGALGGGVFAGSFRQAYPEALPNLPSESAVELVASQGFGGFSGVALVSFERPPAKPSGGARIAPVRVAVGAAHASVKEANGSVWAWGNNLFLDLGLGRVFPEGEYEPRYSSFSSFNTAVPMRLVGLEEQVAALGTTIVEIARVGSAYALLANGLVLAWGGNLEGQLANGFEGENPGPHLYEYATKAEYEAALASYQAMSKAEKAVFNEAQYEAKTFRPGRYPELVKTGPPAGEAKVGVNVLEHVKQMSLGSRVAYFLRENPSTKVKEVWFAGQAYLFEQVRYATKDTRVSKVPLGAGKEIAHLAAARTYYAMLLEDGSVYVIGDNASGVLANGKSGESGGGELSNKVTLPEKATAISAAEYHMVALLESGKVMAWGKNTLGQVGNNADLRKTPPGTTVTSPAYVIDGETGEPLENVVEVEALGEVTSGGTIGGDWNLARLADGTVRVWGSGASGQMCNLTTEDSSAAIQPGKASFPEGLTLNEPPANVTLIAASSSKALVVKKHATPAEPVLRAEPVAGGIALSWTLPEWLTGKWLPTKWTVKHKLLEGSFTGGSTLAAAARSFTITGLVTGEAYEVQVVSTSPPMKYKITEANIVSPGKGEIEIVLAALGAGAREEYGWTFEQRRTQTFVAQPTGVEAEAQFAAAEPAHGTVEQEPFIQARELHGRTDTLYLFPFTEETSRSFKEAKLSKAFIEELEALPNTVKTGVTGVAPNRVVTLAKTDVLEEEHLEIFEAGGKNVNQVVGTWPGVFGTRSLEAVIAG